MQSKQIAEKQFTKVFRGYDIQEVDLFLDEVIRTVEQYETERQALLSRIDRLLCQLERGKQPTPTAGVDSGKPAASAK